MQFHDVLWYSHISLLTLLIYPTGKLRFLLHVLEPVTSQTGQILHWSPLLRMDFHHKLFHDHLVLKPHQPFHLQQTPQQEHHIQALLQVLRHPVLLHKDHVQTKIHSAPFHTESHQRSVRYLSHRRLYEVPLRILYPLGKFHLHPEQLHIWFHKFYLWSLIQHLLSYWILQIQHEILLEQIHPDNDCYQSLIKLPGFFRGMNDSLR